MKSRYLFGLFFILMGLYFLLRNFGLLDFYIPPFLYSWKSILIYIGLAILLKNPRNTAGYTLVLTGGVFIVADYFDLNWADISRLWPLILILLGLSFLLKQQNKSKAKSGKNSNKSTKSKKALSDSTFDIGAHMSEAHYQVTSASFSKGVLGTFMAEVHMDLSRAEWPLENVPNLFINGYFSEVNLYIPKEMSVENEMSFYLGEAEIIGDADVPTSESISIRLKGSMTMGSVKIIYL